MVLADLGATVVKVERPGVGDDTRAWGPPFDERGDGDLLPGGQPQQGAASRIDLTDAGGRRAGARAGRRRRRRRRELPPRRDGAARPRLRRRSRAGDPELVYCSITGFGAGAGAALPGYDLLVQALGGLMSITGEADGEPQKVGVALVDVVAGLFAAVGILAAAAPPRRAPARASASRSTCCRPCSPRWSTRARPTRSAGAVAGRMGNAHPSIAPVRALPHRRRRARPRRRQRPAVRRALRDARRRRAGRDERFATNSARVAHRDGAARRAGRAPRRTRPRPSGSPRCRRPACPPGRSTTSPAPSRSPSARAGSDRRAPPRRRQRRAADAQPHRLSATPATYRCAPPRLPR